MGLNNSYARSQNSQLLIELEKQHFTLHDLAHIMSQLIVETEAHLMQECIYSKKIKNHQKQVQY